MSVAKARCFLDTNILVYAWTGSGTEKGEIARSLISDLVKSNLAVVSTQVLQEFYNVVTTKMNCEKRIAKEAMLRFGRIPLVQIDLALLQQAIDISILTQLSFWDALIIAAAEYANCKVLYSEDMNAGQTIRTATIVNPFSSTGIFRQ
jgi:predicted nucleic acid-binding protein